MGLLPGPRLPVLALADVEALEREVAHLDKSEILHKKTLLEEELRALKAQLSTADADKYHSGVYADREWYRAAHARRAALCRHVQLLQAVIGARTKADKLARIQLSSSDTQLRHRALIDVLKVTLSAEQLVLISRMTEARQRQLAALAPGEHAPALASADRTRLDHVPS